MYFNVQIVSTETIKPFSPTPPDKRIYKRSLLDQLTPVVDVDCVLFYPNALELLPTRHIHDKLKLSLSKALAHFYPLAGRANDALSISCNDIGVSYIEARVPGDMSRVIMNLGSPNHPLMELIPEEQLTNLVDKNRALLSVQVNTFTCGGVAIGVKVTHAIADASALASFLTHWAGISRDSACGSTLVDRGEGIVMDCASLFPPRDLPPVRFSDLISPDKAKTDRVVKRFVFNKYKIASLRERLQGGRLSQRCPTRFEALATLLWAAVVSISQHPLDKTSNKSHFAFNPMNMRNRIDPPLPGRSLGSTIHFAVVEWPMNKVVDLNEMAGMLSNSIRSINDPDVVRNLYSDDKYLNAFQGYLANLAKDANLSIGISSWCRFPFYEIDFGWGKPDLVGVSFPLYTTNTAILIDGKDGEGIEVWIGLAKEDMVRFEQVPDILQYASFHPTSTTKEW